MAELDKIPTKSQIELETVQLEEATLTKLKDLNDTLNILVSDFGQVHIRRKQLLEEMELLEKTLREKEELFKSTNTKLNEEFDMLDEKYPRGQINMATGVITYQPGAPTKKQMQEMQANQQSSK